MKPQATLWAFAALARTVILAASAEPAAGQDGTIRAWGENSVGRSLPCARLWACSTEMRR